MKKKEGAVATTQLSLSFEIPPFDSLKEVVEFAITTSGKSRKYIAADLGITEGTLSMMLSGYEGRHFPLYRLPDLVHALGDRGNLIIQYLVAEFLTPKEDKVAQAAATLTEFARLLPTIQKAAETVMAAQGGKK